MNPLTNVKNIQKLNQRELEQGNFGKKSWHDEYKNSAWVFIGGLPFDLTEGDVICVFSQYGEVVNVNLVRDKGTGKSKGFAFLCYEDQRSTVLAVDNLNSIKILGRTIRVDHVADYKKPKEHGDEDEVTMMLREEGCAPKAPPLANKELGKKPLPVRPSLVTEKSKKKKKKKKKIRVTVKVEHKSDSDDSSDDSSSSDDEKGHHKQRKSSSADSSLKIKQEKPDSGYDHAWFGHEEGSYAFEDKRGKDTSRSRKETGRERGRFKESGSRSQDIQEHNSGISGRAVSQDGRSRSHSQKESDSRDKHRVSDRHQGQKQEMGNYNRERPVFSERDKDERNESSFNQRRGQKRYRDYFEKDESRRGDKTYSRDRDNDSMSNSPESKQYSKKVDKFQKDKYDYDKQGKR